MTFLKLILCNDHNRESALMQKSGLAANVGPSLDLSFTLVEHWIFCLGILFGISYRFDFIKFLKHFKTEKN